ncbi:imidazole glycerol phosphate synthase HisFH, HisH subunit [Campylobacter iguaniorum]|uniref:imidazole glycerol phosphate synthase subunit HisH n=1 Tax=Campylobacter iguaniorum TaxID=1244531 RepID=UPI0007C931C7|nr:imidazole glycerol phosphate synthase subunit HisH [Campylobacter iguaniorum]ANE36314.1 imidazole glycerol phosphate synthase HisFH, HisH subunit [Campylobacter iguaniorum]
MIGIIDYGAGNIRSVINAFSYVGAKSKLVSDANELKNYDKLLLPGVGAFGDAMNKLKSSNLDSAILEFIKTGKPFLGICLGMQLLFEKGFEFGEHDGLGVMEGSVVKFDEAKFDKHLKVPHMGWNVCDFKAQTPINKGLSKEAYLYFVHSYHAVCPANQVLATTNYGYKFVSAIYKDNVYGFQPHPEKSHENGLKIIKNFTEL